MMRGAVASGFLLALLPVFIFSFFPQNMLFSGVILATNLSLQESIPAAKKKAFQLPFHWAILLLERYGIGPLFLFLLGRAAVSSQRGPPRFLSSL